MRLSKVSIIVFAVAAVLCIGCTAALAAPSTEGWILTPVVDGNNVSFVLNIDNMSALTNYDGKITKSWTGMALGGNGGVLNSLTVTVDGDPAVSLEFDYTAGAAGNDVSFLSDLVEFTPLNPVKGTATAAVTVTDRDGDGATATGQFDGKMYRASYGDLPAAGMTRFKDLVGGPVTTSMYASHTNSETTDPLWQGISGPVGDIQSQFKFHLTANDSASGTSYFQVQPVPEPGSLVAMLSGCVGLFGFIRRRRS